MENEREGFFDQKQHEVLAVWLYHNDSKSSSSLGSSSNSFVMLGTNDGYKIFTLDPIKLIKDKDLGGGIAKIGFYSSDKIIWFVGGGDLPAVPNNEFRLWDNHNDEELWKVVAESEIKGVAIKHNLVAIALENKVIFHHLPLTDKFKTFETFNNPFGVICLNKLEGFSTAAFLGEEGGSIIWYDYIKEELKWMIEGDSENQLFITSLALSSQGRTLAAATLEGWTIYLYNTSDGTKLKDYTRGSSPSVINFLKFQLDDTRLIVWSEMGTVHIFMNDTDSENNGVELPKNDVSSFSFLGSLLPYLGKVGSYWKFRTPETFKLAAMPSESSLIVLASNGKLYLANINVEEGGEAIWESKHTLTDSLLVWQNAYFPNK